MYFLTSPTSIPTYIYAQLEARSLGGTGAGMTRLFEFSQTAIPPLRPTPFRRKRSPAGIQRCTYSYHICAILRVLVMGVGGAVMVGVFTANSQFDLITLCGLRPGHKSMAKQSTRSISGCSTKCDTNAITIKLSITGRYNWNPPAYWS